MNRLNWQRFRRHETVLGMAVSEDRCAVVQARVEEGVARPTGSAAVTLTWEQMVQDPERAGRELARQLGAAGLHEKHCCLRLPARWAMTTHADLPELTGEDLRDYLELRVERDLPLSAAEARLAHSVYRVPEQGAKVTVAVIPAKRLTVLERVLHSAGRKLISVSLGLTDCLQGLPEHGGVVYLRSNGHHVDMIVVAGGGVAALRSLQAREGQTPAGLPVDPDLLAREMRITLGQLKPELQVLVREVRLTGPAASVDRLMEVMATLFASLGLERIILDERPSVGEFGAEDDLMVSAALAAVHSLERRAPVFEFVVPKVSRVWLWTEKYGNPQTRRWGAVAAGVVLLVVALMAFQIIRKAQLESEWAAMEPRVEALESLQQQLRTYRPWFDNTAPSLDILYKLTGSFPEEGSVWAKHISIKQNHEVTCSGMARSNQALMETLDRLRLEDTVAEVQVKQVRGEDPIQFTFSFVWNHAAQD